MAECRHTGLVLSSVGLTDQEEEVYRSLVALGGTELDDLARRLGIEEAAAERLVLSLEQLGLVAQAAADGGRRWVAAPPAVALRALVNQKRHELDLVEVTAAQLAEAYRSDAAAAVVQDLVEVVVGKAAVAQRFLQLQLGAVDEVCALVTHTPVAITAPENQAEAVASTRGVTYRVVLEREILDGVDAVAEAVASLRRHEEVRITDRVPTKLVIADRRSAMVPLTADGLEPAALVVHASGLVAPLVDLFDSVWHSAWPIALSEDGPSTGVVERAPHLEEIDGQILSLLLSGLTDASIAKALDIGVRTLQRRIRGLMDLAGVTTRMQLGWEAHSRSWVTRD